MDSFISQLAFFMPIIVFCLLAAWPLKAFVPYYKKRSYFEALLISPFIGCATIFLIAAATMSQHRDGDGFAAGMSIYLFVFVLFGLLSVFGWAFLYIRKTFFSSPKISP